MVESQLIDYIKKARAVGQTDEQTRALLYKNGWTEAEAREAFTVVSQPQPQVVNQPKVTSPPQIQPETQEPMQKKSHIVLKLFVVFIILAIIGGVGYYAIAQTGLLKSWLEVFSFSASSPVAAPIVENDVKNEAPQSVVLSTVMLSSISQDYDISKLTVYSFNMTGDNVAYCVPQKIGNKIDCFLNDKKLDNPYSYKPYWIGASPDGKRVISLYIDFATKQSFIFENGKEGTRYDGTITSPKFSNNSNSFMYIVMGRDNKSFVVLDGRLFAPHDKIYSTPALSNDGKYILYGVRDGQDLFWVADEIK